MRRKKTIPSDKSLPNIQGNDRPGVDDHRKPLWHSVESGVSQDSVTFTDVFGKDLSQVIRPIETLVDKTG